MEFTPDPNHWLYRLDVASWLRAAEAELARTTAAAHDHQRRALVAGARRAAGMAYNAVLLDACLREALPPEQCSLAAHGRSYMDHVRHVALDPAEPAPVRDAARTLLETSPDRQVLVTLGTRAQSEGLLEAARLLVRRATARVASAPDRT